MNGIILATANNKVYESTDGVAWTISDKFSGNVKTFISKIPVDTDTKITYIKTEDGKQYIYSILESELGAADSEKKIEEADKEFPVDNISYTTFSKGSSYYRNIIVGKHEPAIEIDINNKKVPITIAWEQNLQQLTVRHLIIQPLFIITNFFMCLETSSNQSMFLKTKE